MLVHECIPKAKLPDRPNLPWITKHILQLIESCGNRDGTLCACYKELRSRICKMLWQSKRLYYESTDSKTLWKMMKFNKGKSCLLMVMWMYQIIVRRQIY